MGKTESRRATVYVVDDNEAVRKSLALSLTQRGYQVESNASARDFLALEEVNRPACLILDVSMPIMSGPELQQELNRRGNNIPIIFVTGKGSISLAAATMRLGAKDFIEKPCPTDYLIERIEESLREEFATLEKNTQIRQIQANYNRLSQREREVMDTLVSNASEVSNKAIAAKLQISHRTVEAYRARMMSKMNAASLVDLVQMAEVAGLTG